MSYCAKALHRVSQSMVGSTTGTAKSNLISDWRYGTDDAAATVETAGYFNAERAALKAGDTIRASMALGGTPVFKIYVVTAAPATGNVTIALQATTAG